MPRAEGEERRQDLSDLYNLIGELTGIVKGNTRDIELQTSAIGQLRDAVAEVVKQQSENFVVNSRTASQNMLKAAGVMATLFIVVLTLLLNHLIDGHPVRVVKEIERVEDESNIADADLRRDVDLIVENEILRHEIERLKNDQE